MSKAYLMVLRVIALVVVFVLGMLTSVAGIVGAGVFASTGITLDKLEQLGIVIDTSELFDEDNANTSLRSLSILDMIKEINDIVAISDTASLDYLTEEYGLILPPKGELALLDALRVLPFSVLFSQAGLEEATNNIYFGELFGYERREVVENEDDGVQDDDTVEGDQSGDTSTDTEQGGDQSTPENEGAAPTSAVSPSSDNDTADTNDTPTDNTQGDENADDNVDTDNTTDNVQGGEGSDDSVEEIAPKTKYAWYNPETGEKLNGIEPLLYDHTLFEFLSGSFKFEDLITDIRIGDILGLENRDGEWYEADGELAHGIKAAIADQTVNTLESSLDTVIVADLMDYVAGEDLPGKKAGKWYSQNESGEWTEVTGVMSVLAPKHLGELDSALDDVLVGEVMGYTPGTDFEQGKEGDWYKRDENGNWKKITGVMAVLSNKYINDMDGAIDDELMGTLLGYEYIENPDWDETNSDSPQYVWATYNDDKLEYEPVDSLMNAVSNKKFSEIGNLRQDLTLGDVVGNTDCKYVNLIGKETHVDELSSKADEVFETSTMGEFVEAGLIQFENDEDGTKKAKFVKVYGDHNMSEFVELALTLADKAEGVIPSENQN